MIRPTALAAAGLLAILPLSAAGSLEQPSRGHDVQLIAVEYGESLFGSPFAFAEPYPESQVRFGWLFFVIRTGQRIVLVDTGFSDADMVRAFGVDYTDPIGLLATAGIACEDVTDIIITHHHFDHADNLDRFPNARVYCNETELALLEQRNPAVTAEARAEDRLVTFADGYKLFPGLRIDRIGGHSHGSCAVFLSFGRTDYVLAGDEIYLPENISTGNPIGTYVDLEAARAFVERMAHTDAIVLAFHDPDIVPGTHGIRRIQ